MLFDELFKNPVVKQVIASGEEQATRVVGKLLTDERVTRGLQEVLAAAAAARATVETGLQAALHAANLPTADEVRTMRQRLSELEAQVEALHTRVEQAEPATSPAATSPAVAPPAVTSPAATSPETSEP
jgi:polyhydroxyalkanoate synthesis regulator phasin